MSNCSLARRPRLTVCCCILTVSVVWWPAAGQTSGYLRVAPVEGEGAFNSIRTSFVHAPTVRVSDEANNPVAGAEVTFTFPVVGPGAILPGGGHSLTATSETTGLAHCPAYKPNLDEGRFRIHVVASYQGKTGTLVVNQSNTRAGGTSITERRSSKAYWILALVAGGAVGGIFAAKGGSSSPAAAVQATTLTSGAITVGAPR